MLKGKQRICQAAMFTEWL